MSLKKVKNDEFYCESIAKSISEIIRFSLDEDFRNSSFKLFGVSSTKETEKEISKRLMSIIESSSGPRQIKTSRKRKKKLEEKDKENLEEQRQIPNVLETNQPSTTITSNDVQNADSQMLPQNFFKKNWLQISSQQYRDVVKRRKLNYFSQPQFNYSNESDIESSNCDLYSSNSQPTTSNINSLCNDTTASLQLSKDDINFCQKMFKMSFKDNAQKCLKKNSKSHKRLSF